MRSVSWPGQVVVKLSRLARLQKKGCAQGTRRPDPHPTRRVGPAGACYCPVTSEQVLPACDHTVTVAATASVARRTEPQSDESSTRHLLEHLHSSHASRHERHQGTAGAYRVLRPSQSPLAHAARAHPSLGRALGRELSWPAELHTVDGVLRLHRSAEGGVIRSEWCSLPGERRSVE